MLEMVNWTTFDQICGLNFRISKRWCFHRPACPEGYACSASENRVTSVAADTRIMK